MYVYIYIMSICIVIYYKIIKQYIYNDWNYLDNYIWQYVTIYSYNIFIIYNYTKKIQKSNGHQAQSRSKVRTNLSKLKKSLSEETKFSKTCVWRKH